MAETVLVNKKESVWEDLEQMRERIAHRAYDLFLEGGGCLGRDLENWFSAERELLWKPPIELKEKDRKFQLMVAIPGVDPKAIDIEVTAEDLLLKAETRRDSNGEGEELYHAELPTGNLFRAVHFPKKIDPDQVKAEFRNGMLIVTAGLAAEAVARQIEVAAA